MSVIVPAPAEPEIVSSGVVEPGPPAIVTDRPSLVVAAEIPETSDGDKPFSSTTSDKVAYEVSTGSELSVTWTVNESTPMSEFLGEPVRSPDALKLSPAGSLLPFAIDQLSGFEPPWSARTALYGLPATATGRIAVET